MVLSALNLLLEERNDGIVDVKYVGL